jgi:predicted glycoside hydrolase/deacetylase ChbG (UPF0249 family)
MSLPPLVICADDYAISPETSAVILSLLEQGTVNATSCLVEGKAWIQTAAALRRLHDKNQSIAVGLHLNLTESFPGRDSPAIVEPMPLLALRSLLPFQVQFLRAVLKSFAAQWNAFIEGFEAPPDFIDGHRHVHLFPVVRSAFFRLIHDVSFRGWVRQCRVSSKRKIAKRRLLDPLSRGLCRTAASCGVPVNPGFGGLRQFDPGEDIADIWRMDLLSMRSGGVLMVHPGALGARDNADAVGRCRVQEANLLAAGEVQAISDSLGLSFDTKIRSVW